MTAVAGIRVIGLTGGIASGKSVVSRMLRDLSAPVVDADLLARKVVEKGQPAYQDIVREFGPEVLLPGGTIDRKKLGDLVFADEAKRKRLNAITHPRIALAGQEEIARHVQAGAQVVIYEAALLVENQLHKGLGGLIVVAAPLEVQETRLILRDGLSQDQARARLAAQLPLEAKLAVADYVVENTGTLDETRAQVERLWHKLTEDPT
jgi:dephospho-CoA kinase